MNEEQLKKLYNLMKVITMSHKGKKETIEDCLEIDRIIWDMVNERHTKEDLLWANEKWKSYEGKYKDLFKYERKHEEVGRNDVGYSYTKKDGKEICLATIGVFDNKEDKGMVRIRDFYDENGNQIRHDWWKNGALNHKSEGGWYKNGEQDGLWNNWYESGQKRFEGTYKDGIEDGKWTKWYENGKKKFEGTYKDGKEDGLETSWYENGQKRYEETYNDGKRDGLWNDWWSNGQKREEGTFKDGILDGKWTRWYENGQKKSEYTYKDGKLDGKWTSWYESGQMQGEGTYKDGIEDGKWTYWRNSGEKDRVVIFNNGETIKEILEP